MTNRFFLSLAALFGLSGLILDAFGAHGLGENTLAPAFLSAVRYQIFHALFLAIIAGMSPRSLFLTGSGISCIAGIFLFCGSIYVKVLTPLNLEFFTPYGGVLLMFAWLFLLAHALLCRRRLRHDT